jgi:hypothetical protein
MEVGAQQRRCIMWMYWLERNVTAASLRNAGMLRLFAPQIIECENAVHG